MKRDRYFYSVAGAMFLALTVIGFQRYIFGGRHADGSPIDPAMLAIVVAHSSAIFAWFVLFFVQSVLIASKNRKVHMKLGWSVLVIGTTIAVTGPLVAYRSIQVFPSQVVFDWPGPQFLLIMYSEIVLFVGFVAIGVLKRTRPRVHRPMMLLASLSIVSGATARIDLVNAMFGLHHWMAIFGPVFVLGVLLLLVRWALTRKLEREFAVGFAVFTVVTLAVGQAAQTDTWIRLAGMMLK